MNEASLDKIPEMTAEPAPGSHVRSGASCNHSYFRRRHKILPNEPYKTERDPVHNRVDDHDAVKVAKEVPDVEPFSVDLFNASDTMESCLLRFQRSS